MNKKDSICEAFRMILKILIDIVYKMWLCRYPEPICIIYDSNSTFKLHFTSSWNKFVIEHKPTFIMHPQTNDIYMGYLAVLHTKVLVRKEDIFLSDIKQFMMDNCWTVCSNQHIALGFSQLVAIFGIKHSCHTILCHLFITEQFTINSFVMICCCPGNVSTKIIFDPHS